MSANEPTGGEERRGEAGGDRVERLEELAMFNERAVDQLGQQMVDLFAQMHQVIRRLEAMEGRLTSLHDRLENPDPGPEKPPHSA